jgi:hypothetical protein
MTACAIHYRLDGPGPAAFLVDCEGQLRVYARGVLGGVMPRSSLLAVLADRGCQWVPASGAVELDLPDDEGGATGGEAPAYFAVETSSGVAANC